MFGLLILLFLLERPDILIEKSFFKLAKIWCKDDFECLNVDSSCEYLILQISYLKVIKEYNYI